MRQRNKPWAQEKLSSYPQYVIENVVKGIWNEQFVNKQPIHIEVGTGKGQFIVGMAKQHPNINYIGIEIAKNVIVNALEKLIEADVQNIKLLNKNAEDITEIFMKNEVSRIYLNFSDPWPKKRHEKRRLTSKTFLDLYAHILKDDGEIHVKTDNQSLFEYSLVSFAKNGWELQNVSLDLHNSEVEDNIMTEYEQKFSAKGNRIYRCEVRRSI